MTYKKNGYLKIIIFLFIILSLISSKKILAVTPNDLYEPSQNQTDITPPTNATQIRLESTSKGIVITWIDPTDRDFYQMLVYRDYNSGQGALKDNIYGFIAKGIERFLDTGAVKGQTYTYLLKPKDIQGNINTNTN